MYTRSWLLATRKQDISSRSLRITRVVFTLEFDMPDWPDVVADAGTALCLDMIDLLNATGEDEAGLCKRPRALLMAIVNNYMGLILTNMGVKNRDNLWIRKELGGYHISAGCNLCGYIVGATEVVIYERHVRYFVYAIFPAWWKAQV